MSPTAPPPTSYARGRPSWTNRLLLAGWGATGVVAATAAGSALVTGLVLAFVVRQSGMSVHETLVLASLLANGAFGADGVVSGSIMGGGLEAGVGAIPLTITLVVVAATVLVFRRVTARVASAADGLAIAVRAAVVAALVMMVVAVSLHASEAGATVGASAVGAFFLVLLVVLGVLALAVLLRRDWLRSPVARSVHDWVRAPVLGLATMLYLLPLAGVVAALAVLFIGDGTGGYTAGYDAAQWRLIVGGVIAYAGNGGLWAIVLGSAGKVGLFGIDDLKTITGLLGDVDLPTGGRLGWFTGSFDEPGLWICVALAPAVLAAGAYVVVRASRTTPSAPSRGLRGLAVWAVSLLVAVPYGVRLSNVHLHADVDDYGLHLSAGAGAFGLGATFLLFAYAIVVAIVVGLVTRTLTGAALTSARSALGARLSQTSTPARPPGPSGPPPGPPR